MRKKQTFHHESLQETAEVKKVLLALVEGLEEGSIKLNDGSGKIKLKPEGLLNLDVLAMKQTGFNKLCVKITWRDQCDGKQTQDNDPLKISN